MKNQLTYDKDTLYVTTPIFYVNACEFLTQAHERAQTRLTASAPHIGHLYTMILTDVLKRWHEVKDPKNTSFLSTGTDEHGMKIQKAAEKAEMEPQELCDMYSADFMKLVKDSGISSDVFIRTTQTKHKRVVAEFWEQLKRLPRGRGLYKGKHTGWYSVDDEAFYTDDAIETIILPQTGKRVMASKETGSTVEWIEEDTLFFPLSQYKDELLKFYDENPDWIYPRHRMNEVKAWVKDHLTDLSVTRPYKRLRWGIRDPDDKKNTIYVWVDALINYLTVAGYNSSWHQPGADLQFWPPMHVVGKDIIRFHAVYWPALLMAVGLPLPQKIICHNHWTMSNRKMSKSVGNVVNPTFAMQRWGTDPLRYYLMRNGSFKNDMDYSNENMSMVYLKELQANIGNLYLRVARPKSNRTPKWTTREAIEAKINGSIEKNRVLDNPAAPQTHYSYLEPYLESIPSEFAAKMDDHDIQGAIGEVTKLMMEANRYLAHVEPWKVYKPYDPEARVIVNWIIYNAAEAIRIGCILLQPIMPTKMTEILDTLRVSPNRRTLEYAKPGLDLDYGLNAEDLGAMKRVNPWDSFFPPVPGAHLTDEDVREEFTEAMKTRVPGREPKKNDVPEEYYAMRKRMSDDSALELLKYGRKWESVRR